MPVKPCATSPFEQRTINDLPFGTAIGNLTRTVKAGHADWVLNICRRSSIPVWGLEFDNAKNAYYFLPSTKENAQTIMEIFKACYFASQNFVKDDIVNPDKYISGEYGDYLYRKINAEKCLEYRYFEMAAKIVQFYEKYDFGGGYDATAYNDLHNTLIPTLQRETDKALYIPAGQYNFQFGSAANTALEAWLAADPTLDSLMMAEVIS